MIKLNYGQLLKYTFTGKGWFKKFLLGSLSTLLIPLSLGYFIRTYRRIIHGDNDLPEWNDIMEMFSQGMIVLLIIIIYLLVPLLLILTGYFLLGGGAGLISSEGTISFTGMIISSFVLAGIFLFIFSLLLLPQALASYADTLDIMEPLRVKEVIKKIFSKIESYFTVLIVYLCVSGSVIAIFWFILPCAVFYIQLFYANIFALVYAETQD